jgi:hypothetical protein
MPLPPAAARVPPGAARARIAGGISVPRPRRVRARGTRGWSAAAPAPGWPGRCSRGRSRGRCGGGPAAGRGARAALGDCLASPVRQGRRGRPGRGRPSRARPSLRRRRLSRGGRGRARPRLSRGRLGRGRRRLSLGRGLVIWPRPRHVPDPHRGIQRDLHPGHRVLHHQSSTTTRGRAYRSRAIRRPGRHRGVPGAGNVPDPRCPDTVPPS